MTYIYYRITHKHYLMKSISKLLKSTAFLYLFTGRGSCSDDEDSVTPPVVDYNTIGDFVANNDNNSSLKAAL